MSENFRLAFLMLYSGRDLRGPNPLRKFWVLSERKTEKNRWVFYTRELQKRVLRNTWWASDRALSQSAHAELRECRLVHIHGFFEKVSSKYAGASCCVNCRALWNRTRGVHSQSTRRILSGVH